MMIRPTRRMVGLPVRHVPAGAAGRARGVWRRRPARETSDEAEREHQERPHRVGCDEQGPCRGGDDEENVHQAQEVPHEERACAARGGPVPAARRPGRARRDHDVSPPGGEGEGGRELPARGEHEEADPDEPGDVERHELPEVDAGEPDPEAGEDGAGHQQRRGQARQHELRTGRAKLGRRPEPTITRAPEREQGGDPVGPGPARGGGHRHPFCPFCPGPRGERRGLHAEFLLQRRECPRCTRRARTTRA